MNLGMKKVKKHIMKQKKLYLCILIVTLISILLGILFWFMISKEDTSLVINELTSFFNNIKMDTNINYFSSLINSLVINFIYILLIWLLGISIIGIPFIILLILIRGFIMGFSIVSIIATYGFKGVLGAFSYIFPHQICFLILLILLGFNACNFCIKLFRYLFLKQNINFKIAMHKYIKIFFFSLLIIIILSLFETFISIYLMRLFTLII